MGWGRRIILVPKGSISRRMWLVRRRTTPETGSESDYIRPIGPFHRKPGKLVLANGLFHFWASLARHRGVSRGTALFRVSRRAVERLGRQLGGES